MRLLSSPHSQYDRRTTDLDAQFFQQLVRDEQIVDFVVGLPVHMSGDESEKSIEARAFGAWLNETTQVPVEFFDERFSTKEANAYLAQSSMGRSKKKQRRDMMAAHVLLRNYLERGTGSAPQSLDD